MEITDEVRWGIVGCGDVCEIKSGPAFNKVGHSRLIAVMRRDAHKAKDFALRHQVPKYFDNASTLIADPDVNAIYVATPPAYHEEYAIQAIRAGKPVYVEKPLALNSESCKRIADAARQSGIKVSVAHYRRGLPLFKEVKSILAKGTIGSPRLILIRTLQPPHPQAGSPAYWRTHPEISGGGLFFDLSPHQLDVLYWIFGAPLAFHGVSLEQRKGYGVPDLTTVEGVFPGEVFFQGTWAFNVSPSAEEEQCEIIGDRGKITFSFFRKSDIEINTPEDFQRLTFDYPENIQQPMIDQVVKFFRGEGPNPCSLEEALVTMDMMESTRQCGSLAQPWKNA